MGYRRNSDKALVWKKWLQLHSELILASGVSSEAIQSEDDWWEYLQHELRLPASSQQADALRQLILSWPGGSETLLGDVFGLRLHRTASS